MKTIDVKGSSCQFFLEKASDGGCILNTLVPQPDGSFQNFRHWYSDPAAARQEYDSLDVAEATKRADRARSEGVSGKRHAG